jgi:hypothetical protein
LLRQERLHHFWEVSRTRTLPAIGWRPSRALGNFRKRNLAKVALEKRTRPLLSDP